MVTETQCVQQCLQILTEGSQWWCSTDWYWQTVPCPWNSEVECIITKADCWICKKITTVVLEEQKWRRRWMTAGWWMLSAIC